MQHHLTLPSRPFNAIKNGTKKVEGRTPTKHTPADYSKIKAGDTIKITNEDTGKTLLVEVQYNRRYPTVRKMLESEGVENVLSSEPKTVEHGIESYHSLTDYEENIKKHGIYAIGVKPLIGRPSWRQ